MIKKLKIPFSSKQLALLKLVSEYSDECKGSILKFIQYAAIEKALEVLALLRKDKESDGDPIRDTATDTERTGTGSDQGEEPQEVLSASEGEG